MAAAVVAVFRRRELAEAYHLIARVRLPELAVSVGFEALSIVCFAAVQRWLLRAGGVRWGMRRMTAIAAAANAVAGALPGGAAFSAAWVFRQLSRRGVEQVLAAAVLVAGGALAVLSLFVLLVIGSLAAGSAGPGAVARPAVGVLVLALTFGLVVLGLSRFAGFRRAVRRAWTHTGERSSRVRRAEEALVRLAGQARGVRPGFLSWLWPFALALLNWVADAACLAAGLWALGIGVPWHGLLLAYTLTQITGSLRLTPGSLGIVEASLSALLVAYGLQPGQAIAATFLYRIISYWALQPIGWACWIGVTLSAARPRPLARGTGRP
ncbi:MULTISPECIES: lysylphosphatidylglycerol synthase transmembrane domain-containing protein [Streptomyces]|uniref:lysylphosphatidylglycerol synthase transmembrane domain-containing protein n=1 Tax=Streptomyces TaxID=1883 RepID=UPI00031D4641|nr:MULTISPECIES: lysylphosphatidylglycerol synthase transmembrane domain-containing protein [Streptomyces]